MRLLSLSILTLLYILSSVHSAEAHRPYLVKDKTFETPKGIIITERLYGDGIVVTDPMQYQIRDGKGNVLANTKTYNHIATFCPNLKFCWAFPYDGFTILSVGQKLDYKGLDLEKEKPVEKLWLPQPAQDRPKMAASPVKMAQDRPKTAPRRS